MNDGLLDTNVVVHSFEPGPLGVECSTFLRDLEAGRAQAVLDPLVVHELTYVLPRYLKQFTRSDVAGYLTDLVNLRGIIADKILLIEALRLWATTSGLGFVDAYLVTRARRENRQIYTKNVRELAQLGATIPQPLSAER